MTRRKIDSYDVVMRTPARAWQDALWVGNGVSGAMLFGNRAHERVILNHIGLWLPALPRLRQRGALHQYLPEIRALLRQGQAEAAEKLWLRAAKAAGWMFVYTDPSHPAGQITFAADCAGTYSDYQRILKCAAGVAQVVWQEHGVLCLREVFASRRDHVIVLRMSTASPAGISGLLRLDPVDTKGQKVWIGTTYPTLGEGWGGSQPPVTDLVGFEQSLQDNWFTLRGTYTHGGCFGVTARVLWEGGTVSARDGALRLDGVQSVTIIADVGCNEEENAQGRQHVSAASALGYDSLRARHVALHQELFTRCTLELGTGESRSAEEWLLQAQAGDVAPELAMQMWALGRHLFISSCTAEGRYPPHLQGLWTGTYSPPWYGNYTLDENVQMMHWQAEPGRLGDLTMPLHRYLRASRTDWARNAQELFGCRGLLAPLMQSGDNGRADCAEWHFWISGAGWLARHVWERWVYSGNITFLREYVLPLLAGVAEFYQDYLVPGADGKLQFIPSVSVENTPIGWGARAAIDATMDVAVAREVLQRLCAARDILGLDPGETADWRAFLQRLPEYRINSDGALAEWVPPELQDQYRHRHVSHLYPVFPGEEVTATSHPALMAAAREAVARRRVTGLASQTGWSYAHLAHVYARLGDGAEAWACLSNLVRSCVQDNLLTTCNDWRGMGLTMGGITERGAVQLDANMGFTSAVQMMLVACDAQGVRIFPALPAAWPQGRIGPVATRWGVTAEVTWSAGQARVELVGDAAGSVRVDCASGWRVVKDETQAARRSLVLCEQR